MHAHRFASCMRVLIDRFGTDSLGVNLAHGVMGGSWRWPLTYRGGGLGPLASSDWLNGRHR